MNKTAPALIGIFLLAFLPSKAQVPDTVSTVSANSFLKIPANYYTQHSGVFCRKELQLQKNIKINVFFRLGSKEYVDYLERKPNAVKFK